MTKKTTIAEMLSAIKPAQKVGIDQILIGQRPHAAAKTATPVVVMQQAKACLYAQMHA